MPWSRPTQTPSHKQLMRPPTVARSRPPRITSRALHRPTMGRTMTRGRTRGRMIRVTENSRQPTLPRRRHRCLNTTSPRLPATTICGLLAIGHGAKAATTGYPAYGLRLPTRVPFGRPATGVSTITATGFTVATGAHTSATTAASITALATLASDTKEAIGAAATSITTAHTTTWAAAGYTTSITARAAITTGAAHASVSTVAQVECRCEQGPWNWLHGMTSMPRP